MKRIKKCVECLKVKTVKHFPRMKHNNYRFSKWCYSCRSKYDKGQKHEILINKKFGKLLVKKLEGRNKFNQLQWLCKCECGKTTIVPGFILKRGKTKSCGCLRDKFLPDGEAARRRIVRAYTSQAKIRNLEWKLKDVQITNLLSEECTICGVVEYSTMAAKRNNNTDIFKYNGIDRIDNLKGYTINNVRTMCFLCNRAKNNLTEEEFQGWIKRIKKRK